MAPNDTFIRAKTEPKRISTTKGYAKYQPNMPKNHNMKLGQITER